LGFEFLDIFVNNLKPKENNPAPKKDGGTKKDPRIQTGTLHYKYMSKTGEWGIKDIAYPAIAK